MRGSVKKSALILGVLLLSIAAAGQVFPGRDSQADVPVVTERVLVPGGQSVGGENGRQRGSGRRTGRNRE